MGTLMLGITPTVFLHRIAANHIDSVDILKKGCCNHISKATIHCSLENSAAYSPFIFSIAAPSVLPILNCIIPIPLYKNNFYSIHHFYCELRGPPSC